MTLDITTPLRFEACDNYDNALQIHDGARQIAIVEAAADTEGTPAEDYTRSSKDSLAYARFFTSSPALLEIAKRHRHLLSELHAGNAFSKEYLWQQLTETEVALAKAGAA